MKKHELLKLIESVGDDEEIYIISSSYDEKDDNTWSENMVEVIDVEVMDGEGFIRIDVEEF